MDKTFIITFFKGFLIGSTMIIPGISGGSMALILGIYDELIFAVSSFRENVKKNAVFLLLFSAGAGMGILVSSRPVSWLLEHYPMQTLYFFLGAVLGGIPAIEKKSGIKRISPDVLFYLILGFIIVFFIGRLPENFFTEFFHSWFSLFVGGLLSTVALILPGISFSHFLLILGIYHDFLTSIYTIDLSFLAPLGAGLILGIVLFTKILGFWLEKYPKSAYLTILGFVLGSAISIFPGFPSLLEIVPCTFFTAGGFVSIYLISRKNCDCA